MYHELYDEKYHNFYDKIYHDLYDVIDMYEYLIIIMLCMYGLINSDAIFEIVQKSPIHCVKDATMSTIAKCMLYYFTSTATGHTSRNFGRAAISHPYQSPAEKNTMLMYQYVLALNQL